MPKSAPVKEQPITEQLAAPESRVQRSLITVVVVVIAIAIIASILFHIRLSDPYIRDVLAIEGQVQQGNAIFQLNCAGCHGSTASGKVGPSLKGVSTRRSQIGLIHQITSGKTPPMPKFQASPEEMANLLSYLNSL